MISLTIHGVRGSIPATGTEFSKYGGNTTCFEIETNGSQMFIDAGTGFSLADLNSDEKKVYLLFSHLHHDHLQGLLFNPQIFSRDQEIFVSSALMSGANLRQHICEYFSPPFFPPNVFSYASCLKFIDFEHFTEQVGSDVNVECIGLKHPGGAMGYSFSADTTKVVIALDNEFESQQERELLEFCENADILIWDGMYTDAEMINKQGWGHSTIEQAINFTKKSGVKRTVICHHAPTRNDDDLDAMSNQILTENVEFGVEGTKFNL